MRKSIIWISSVSLAIVLGVSLGFVYNSNNDTHVEDNNTLTAPITNNLSEEFWNVDLIVKGKVIQEEATFQKDTGVDTKIPSKMEVTPATIEVDEVIYGNEPNKTITYLQHGNSNETAKPKHVQKNDEVILILTRTTDGQYWSYNFDDGIWYVKNGKVKSNTSEKYLVDYKDKDAKDFIKEIRKAAKNKKKNENYKQ
ncbi:hypothetical protein ERL59_03730 [Chengkuizengella sp. YPA3-1-1]|uniref:Uncharacterized protein n=1 Tax=Chengkuizengella marina TaxID=2507566 RepID=A0A6N9PX33_9BACL|nr:hypothetical protein [Chengkuizengella marina]